MNPVASHAEALLHAAPHPALRLLELVEPLSERVGRRLSPATLRRILEERPDRFRILDSWEAGWRVREERDGCADAEAWVVAVERPDPPPDAPRPALLLRESVRYVALRLDGRSRLDVSRWYAIALAERAVRDAVARRAAA